MKMLHSNKSKFIALLTICMLGLFSIFVSAQDKDKTNSKLDQLKGKVERITVIVDGREVVFEGKEAEKLAKQIRRPGHFEVITESDEGDSNVIMLSTRDKGKGVSINTVDDKKKIQIEDKDGEKIVTVTTTKKGKDEVKTYKGEEAEKYLKEEQGKRHFRIFTDNDREIPHKKFMSYYFGDDDESCCCCGRKMMMKSHMPGTMKHFIFKELDEDDNVKDEKADKK